MKKQIIPAFILLLSLVASIFAHDLFLKPDSFFAAVKSKVTISILNGSFQESEGAVSFVRLNDVSVIAPDGKISNPVEADFTKNETTSFLNFVPHTATTPTLLAQPPRLPQLDACPGD